MHINPRNLCISIMACMAWISCTRQDICLEPQTVSLRGTFYAQDSSGNLKDSFLTNANLFFGSSWNFISRLKSASRFGIPLSQQQDSVKLLFQADSAITDPATIDTLSIYYQRKLSFISVACGYQTQFLINRVSVTHQVIDTIIVQQAEVNQDISKNHLRIVLKP